VPVPLATATLLSFATLYLHTCHSPRTLARRVHVALHATLRHTRAVNGRVALLRNAKSAHVSLTTAALLSIAALYPHTCCSPRPRCYPSQHSICTWAIPHGCVARIHPHTCHSPRPRCSPSQRFTYTRATHHGRVALHTCHSPRSRCFPPQRSGTHGPFPTAASRSFATLYLDTCHSPRPRCFPSQRSTYTRATHYVYGRVALHRNALLHMGHSPRLRCSDSLRNTRIYTSAHVSLATAASLSIATLWVHTCHPPRPRCSPSQRSIYTWAIHHGLELVALHRNALAIQGPFTTAALLSIATLWVHTCHPPRPRCSPSHRSTYARATHHGLELVALHRNTLSTHVPFTTAALLSIATLYLHMGHSPRPRCSPSQCSPLVALHRNAPSTHVPLITAALLSIAMLYLRKCHSPHPSRQRDLRRTCSRTQCAKRAYCTHVQRILRNHGTQRAICAQRALCAQRAQSVSHVPSTHSSCSVRSTHPVRSPRLFRVVQRTQRAHCAQLTRFLRSFIALVLFAITALYVRALRAQSARLSHSSCSLRSTRPTRSTRSFNALIVLTALDAPDALAALIQRTHRAFCARRA
jgi:hypothetical protein